MPGTAIAKPVWAQQIQTVRKRLNLSQQAFAEKLSTTQSNVAKWESGKYKPVPAAFIELAKLAPDEIESLAFLEHGGVPRDFFSNGSPKGMVPKAIAESAVRDAENRRLGDLAASGFVINKDDGIRHVPLLRDPAAAGTPRAIDEKEIERLVPVPKEWLPSGGTLFALKVSGDSMDPILLDGHIVIVNVDRREPKDLVNSMVVARNDGITIKWLREDDGEYLLVPHHVSVRHPIRRLKRGGASIVGEVVKWIGQPPKTARRK